MCIIIVIPYGEKIPKKEVFKICAKNNPNGMGFMYRRNGKIRIKKGFFNVDNFYNAVKNIKDSEICLHFRYTTHGKTCAGNCHPFPVSNDVADLTKTKIDCKIGIAHNGIISGMTVDNDLSDTMVFIRDLNTDNVKTIPEKIGISDGKFLIMTQYKTYLIGDYHYDEGLYYSNEGYKKVQSYISYSLAGNCDPFIEGSELCEYCKHQYIEKGIVTDPCLDCDGMCNFDLSENKEDQSRFYSDENDPLYGWSHYLYDDEEYLNVKTSTKNKEQSKIKEEWSYAP